MLAFMYVQLVYRSQKWSTIGASYSCCSGDIRSSVLTSSTTAKNENAVSEFDSRPVHPRWSIRTFHLICLSKHVLAAEIHRGLGRLVFVLVSVGRWSDKICWPAGVENKYRGRIEKNRHIVRKVRSESVN